RARTSGRRAGTRTASGRGRVSRWGPAAARLSSAGLGPFHGAGDRYCGAAVASVARGDRLFPKLSYSRSRLRWWRGRGRVQLRPVPLAYYQDFLTVGRASCLDAHEVHPLGDLRARLVSSVPGEDVPTRGLMSIPE